MHVARTEHYFYNKLGRLDRLIAAVRLFPEDFSLERDPFEIKFDLSGLVIGTA